MASHSGRLITFHNDPFLKIPVFISGEAPRCILWLGGQSDELFACTFMPLLIQEAGRYGWSVAQMVPASNFTGKFRGTHVTDAEDLSDLVELLIKQHSMKEIALFGYSTGVQIVLEYLENGKNCDVVTRVILQGIVTNPKGPFFIEEGKRRREDAVAEIERLYLEHIEQESPQNFLTGFNDISSMVRHYDVPITPARCSKGGYLTLMEAFWVPAHRGDAAAVAAALSPVRVPLLIMLAMTPRYTVSAEDKAGFVKLLRNAAHTNELTVTYFNDVCDERRRMLKAEDASHVASIVSFLNDQEEKRTAYEKARAEEIEEIERKNKSILAKSALRIE